MPTTRATVIDVGAPLGGSEEAAAWLKRAGEPELAAGLAVLNRALHAFRIAAADPHEHGVGRDDALAARLGYGAGEQVAEGRWADARDLIGSEPRHRRRRIPAAQARFAAILTGHQSSLACEELALRARLDLDEQRHREAALQVGIALDAALAELAADPTAPALGERLEELRGLREIVTSVARQALDAELDADGREALAHALARVEAALRARTAALPR